MRPASFGGCLLKSVCHLFQGLEQIAVGNVKVREASFNGQVAEAVGFFCAFGVELLLKPCDFILNLRYL